MDVGVLGIGEMWFIAAGDPNEVLAFSLIGCDSMHA